jgi:ABC-2 type transport system ATP-binding protein
LSGGMKQKLALACTLIHRPDILLLDEPTTGVDPVSRREFWKLLAEFLSRGVTIVMATPYLDEAERCSRVALLHEGRLLALDRPEVLRSQLPGQVAELMAGDKRRAAELLERMPGVLGVQMFGERAHVRFDPAVIRDPADLSARLGAEGVPVDNIRPIPASLEDVFIARLSEARS